MSESKKTDALAIIGLSDVEAIKIDRERKLTVFEKKELMNIVENAMYSRSHLVKQMIEKTKEKIVSGLRGKSNHKSACSEYRKLEKKISVTRSKHEAIMSMLNDELEVLGDMVNDTGFDLDGELLKPSNKNSYGYKAPKTEAEKERMRIRDEQRQKNVDFVEDALKVFDGITSKFEKIKAKILFTDKVGDWSDIIETLFGNGDEILK